MGILESMKALLSRPGEEKPMNAASAARAYVDWLPGYMLGTSVTQTIIDSRRPLPGVNTYSGDMPRSETVVNRLKILSGLSPVQYNTQQMGQFTQQTGCYRVTLKTTFNDQDGRSRCSVEISIRAQ